jgi:hypothetical protein
MGGANEALGMLSVRRHFERKRPGRVGLLRHLGRAAGGALSDFASMEMLDVHAWALAVLDF